ncbi:type II secretion system protein GspM [Blastochloris sulfoviridis]|uniref:General secretion pathway protein GspM n=1 Tax=Blastochloris sulfoviridis TaxID=50712 RepID=A0A5M6I640_9HYPH|nr:type II secretion system protein GspM [Blastochloris sulfoviridis]KAA5603684.1 general secretion pathway protein GspM [Blastochloris sulfoviridis]
MSAPRFESLPARFPVAAAALYAAVLVAFAVMALDSAVDAAARRGAALDAADILGQLEGRSPKRTLSAADPAVAAGSPFVEGSSLSVAGAALLQRVAGAITRAGGHVMSSQVDLQGPQSKAGFITVTASCEIKPAALQPLLYDVEAGMPFLFVEQLVVQAPAGAAATPEGRMRVLLAVSGQWQGAK